MKLESVMKSTSKRTQRDYSLAFKLTVATDNTCVVVLNYWMQ
ncbi:Mobile element protein (plasmid) [Vibrio parahaemolyticus]|uniref:Transposase n=1 Tax=Vibrio parahaemolyticus TaxID=670 RepID=A0A1Y1B9H7_VIBPH|nr:Mobile element protein [Vibrio parahaemolyticus]BAX56781.1 transposase [Vibrio parahaemolyticus]BAX57043.1 transposase [Vibrio parahaemolyticus]